MPLIDTPKGHVNFPDEMTEEPINSALAIEFPRPLADNESRLPASMRQGKSPQDSGTTWADVGNAILTTPVTSVL